MIFRKRTDLFDFEWQKPTQKGAVSFWFFKVELDLLLKPAIDITLLGVGSNCVVLR